ncbi:MAG: FHA domain-containing protein [Vicinamibacterales bacterium]
MNILQKVKRLEAGMTRAVERAAREWSQSGAREPLEIGQAIVDAVGERLEPAARGRYVFPFNRIHVTIAASRDARARFQAVFESEPTLQERIVARLRDAGCSPASVQCAVTYVARPSPDWPTPEFHIEFTRGAAAPVPVQEPEPAPVAAPEAARQLQITIVSGTAEAPSYTFTLPRVNLGRCAEVRDSLSRLVRTNHVAFVDLAGTSNHSVSRRHAHIEYIESARQYRIRDDRSAHGTHIVRNGRTVPVPAGPRGVRLESGDEIVLGEARARVVVLGP